MKKYLLGLFAIALAIGFTAFTGTPAKKSLRGFTVYFSYDLPNGSEGNYTTDNWTEISAPGSDPCPTPPNNDPCVIAVDSDVINLIAADDTPAEREAKLVTHLQGLGSATTFVNSATIYQKP